MKRLCGLGLGLLVLATGPLPAEAPKQGRELTVEESKEVARLDEEATRQLNAGRFEDAVQTAKRIVAYRIERQGPKHWQVIDARLNVEEWQRLTGVAAQDRAEVVRAMVAGANGIRLQQQQHYRLAEAKLREALAIDRKVLGEQHPATAADYNRLAVCLQHQARSAEALPLFQKALALRLKGLGEQHPDSAQSYNNVALCLHSQGRGADALSLFQKALAIRLKVLGDQHLSTAQSYNNVAVCLDNQGKHAEALSLYRKALAIRQTVRGEQHPETAQSYNNVAFCLLNQGSSAEALPLFQKALAIYRKALGEQHPDTASGYNNVASCLQSLGKIADALPLYQKALAIRLKVLGAQHPATAQSYNNVAFCLAALGKHGDALPLFQKALAINRRVQGEQHANTALSYNNVAACLDKLGKHADALPLHRKALAIRQTGRGEQHPETAQSYNNVAFCLDAQGKHAEALSLFQKALTIRLKVLGVQHSDTAASYNNVASCLQSQGKYAEALPLSQKALAIKRKVLGEQHPDTALSCNNVAFCLANQGRYADALPLYQQALDIKRKVLGEQHPDTAASYNNVASCLQRQEKYVEALPLFQKALAIFRKALGELHPDTAAGYNNVAFCLQSLGKPAEALSLYRKALAIERKLLGEQHPDTAQSYDNVAGCLESQGKYAAAAHFWEKALVGYECGRLQASSSGFDRALFHVEYVSPRSALAVCLVRLEKPREAWQHAETDLARGLLDDLLPAAEDTDDARRRVRVGNLDQILLPLIALENPDAEQVKRREALSRERDALLAELADSAARRSRARVLPLERIQRQLPSDAALIFWLDVGAEHWGCVLRRQGPPLWVTLPGSGKKAAWNKEDATLPARVLTALADGKGDAALRQRLLAQLHRQRVAPLEAHLQGVRQLLVVPAGKMAAIPVEALTDRYTISYVPSASVFARAAEQHRPLQASSLLVLADPVFSRAAPVLPPAPPHGLLILTVTPGSPAARIGLQPGDVLLEYNGKQLTAAADLTPPADRDRVPLKLWREGKTLAGRLAAGKLGVVIDRRPVAEALAAWRQQERDLLALGRGEDWQALPGTRLEARTLAALVPQTTTLLGSDASQQKLAELAAADKLKSFRLLHLATHGQANAIRPERTALILAQDHLPDDAEAAKLVLAGQKPVDGRLTVGTILADWHLDADLVVLSACQTGLGKDSAGEGMLGFTQALLQKGARSGLLSRWKVDDAATSLLMARFYENLLGARKETKPLGRAAALAEAKAWLRQLSRAEATTRLAALVDGVPRGERGSIKAALPTRKPDASRGADRPFAAPYFWAAFVLLGDPQ